MQGDRTGKPHQSHFIPLVPKDAHVDDEGHLLYIDTSSEQVGGDQDSGGSRSELLHDDLTSPLVHISMHGRHGELLLVEFGGKPVDLSSGRAEDDGLCDGDGLVQVAKGLELPVLFLNSNVELPDTLEGELVLLDENSDRVTHELLGDFKDIRRHGSGQQDDLSLSGKKLENVVDRIFESGRKHLIGLVEAEHLDPIGFESSSIDHVEYSSRSSNDDVGSLVELGDVLSDGGSSDTCVAVNVEVVSEGDDDLLDLLSEFSSGSNNQRLSLLDSRVDLPEV